MMMNERHGTFMGKASAIGRIARISGGPRLVFVGNPFAVEERVVENLKAKIKAMERLDNSEKAGNLIV